jgi:hypothetical protein
MNARASHRQATPWRADGKTIRDNDGRIVATVQSATDARLMAQAPRLAAILAIVVDWQEKGADGPIETWIGRTGLGIWGDAVQALRNAGALLSDCPRIEGRKVQP